MKIPEQIIENAPSQVSAPKINSQRLDDQGREVFDSRPMEPPLGYSPRESLSQQIRRMVLQASQELAEAGVESIEEANDFYIDDDPESMLPPSQYEFDEDHHLEQLLEEKRQNAIEAGREALLRQSQPPPATPLAEEPKKRSGDPRQLDIEDKL